jgi:hypothetical protein
MPNYLRRRGNSNGVVMHEHVTIAQQLIQPHLSKYCDPVGTRSGDGNA